MPFSSLSDLLENKLVLLQVQHFPPVGYKVLLWRSEVLPTICPKSKREGVEWLTETFLEGIELART